MGRRLKDKLLKVTIPSERITEAHWQQRLRERDVRGKLRHKEYADSKRSAQYSDIVEGDRILLNKSYDNKLSPNFEPVPYKVVDKNGNAVLIEDKDGNTKLRNTSHLKKSLQPDPCTEATEVNGGDEAEDMPTVRQSEAAALIPPTNIETSPTLPPESSASPPPSRPTRVRRPPAWISDFVSFCA